MDEHARQQLYSEENTWLNRSRTRLLEALLRRVGNINAPLLEVGAGSGHAIPTLSHFGQVDALEVAPEAWPLIERMPIRQLYKEPIPSPEPSGPYGTIVGLEVLEHIEDDRAAAQWLSDRLEPGGTLVLTVPAYQWLFGPHDVVNQHFRRYTKKSLVAALPEELELLSTGYFMTALFPVAAVARLLFNLRDRGADGGKQKSRLPGAVDKLFEGIMALEAAFAGRRFTSPFGLTVYVVARKLGAPDC